MGRGRFLHCQRQRQDRGPHGAVDSVPLVLVAFTMVFVSIHPTYSTQRVTARIVHWGYLAAGIVHFDGAWACCMFVALFTWA